MKSNTYTVAVHVWATSNLIMNISYISTYIKAAIIILKRQISLFAMKYFETSKYILSKLFLH